MDLTPPGQGASHTGGAGGNGEDAPASADTILGSGGIISTGGSSENGGAPGTGGAGSRDASNRDADAWGADLVAEAPSPIDGEIAADASVQTGGVLGSGGTSGAGGMTGTGGASEDDGGAGTGGPDGHGDPDAPASTGGAVATGGTVATGGVVGSGGAGTGGAGTGGATGTGGTSITFHCASAVEPANGGIAGFVTDFADWDATAKRWGASDGLFGSTFIYAGSSSAMNPPEVEGKPVGLHLTGEVPSGGFAGGGLAFLVCATAVSFSEIAFDIYGGAPGCSLELQIQTFDQRPTDQSPPGGCDRRDGGSCFNYPALKGIVDVSSTITSAKTVTATLADFSGWSTTRAGQIVGLQWQFTGTALTGSATCPIDVTITNIKLAP